jgi:uncharacterized protein
MPKKIIILLFCLILYSVSAAEIPIVTNYVTDNALILSADDEARISDIAYKIEKETSVEIAVVTVKTLEGIPLEEYAVRLFEKSGIGKKDVDNGLLLLIALDEHEYRIEVGYGLEAIIPDAKARELGVEILESNFKKDQFGPGIYDMLEYVYGILSGNEEIVSAQKNRYFAVTQGYNKTKTFSIITAILIIFILVSFISSVREDRTHRKFRLFPFFWGFGGGFNRGGFRTFGNSGFGGFGGGMSGGGGFSGKF